jgi:hypothetical protein
VAVVPDEQAPDRRLGRPRREPLLVVRAPHAARSVFSTGWPMILLVLVIAYAFATFFPALGGLLLIAAPLAVFGAFCVGVLRARNITLLVTDEVIRVTSGKAGNACDRAELEKAVLVEDLVHRLLVPRTEDLILLDRDGRTALVLSGLLWPPAVIEQVIELLQPLPVERVEGKQTLNSLSARYPRIGQTTAGIHRGRSRRPPG